MADLPNPFIPAPAGDDHRFVLDERAFMEAIEPPPLFLSDPSPAFTMRDALKVVRVLAGR